MAQPNRGGHGSAPISKPIETEKVEQKGGSAQGSTMFGWTPKGVGGSKKS